MGSETSHAENIALAVQRLNHSATLSVQPSKYELSFFSFLFSIDSYSNRPVDAHFWSEIDLLLIFSYPDCLFGNWRQIFLTEKLVSSLLLIFFVNWKNGQRSSDSSPSTVTIILFSFLFSIDSISNPPVDALFWSQIDYCWFFSYLDILFGNW